MSEEENTQVSDLLSGMGELDPEVAKLIGQPGDLDEEIQDEIPVIETPSKKTLEAMRKGLTETPTAGDQDPTLQRRIGRHWASLVQGAQSARIYHRPHIGPGAGSLRLIGEFAIRDIQAAGSDLTRFVTDNLVPTWGGGDYHAYIVDPKTHREVAVAHVPIASKPPQDKNETEMTIATTLLQALLSEKNQPRPEPPSMASQMKEFRELMTMMGGEDGKKGGGMDPMMMLMFMQSMQPKPEPKPDPMILSLLERFDRRLETMEKEAKGGGALPPPPPPPPPGPDVIDIISKLAPLLKPEIPKSEIGVMDIIKLMQDSRKDEDRLGLRDVIQLLDRKNGEGPASIQDKLQEMLQLRELASQLGGGGGGGAETNFWDALVGLAQHPALASGIGKALEASASRPVQGPTIVSNKPARQREQAPPQVQNVAPAGHMAAGDDLQPQEPPRIPQTVLPHLREIEESLLIPAEIEARKARVVATVKALIALWNDPHWNGIVVEILGYVVNNDQERALKGLGGCLGFMRHHGLLKPEAGKAAITDFRDHWDALQPELTAKLGGFLTAAGLAPAPVQGPSNPVRPPTPPAAAAEPAEEVEESEESEEETEDDDEAEEEGAEENGGEEAAAAGPPPLFVTEIPEDNIDALFRQSQQNVF